MISWWMPKIKYFIVIDVNEKEHADDITQPTNNKIVETVEILDNSLDERWMGLAARLAN